MIQELVQAWEENKTLIRATLAKKHPSYEDIVRAVAQHMPNMKADNIHRIDDGDYQGTLLFIIPEDSYQPSQYWSTKVYYGSCSGCDTLASIRESGSYDDDKPSERQLDGYMSLALHLVQGFKEI